ncbi:hypothetical protein EPR50_G00041660 [Perca flavescens]|uniref:Uncharacterized protein n=1 Tax=Perca flavescens TaxID=8167 RepID=A0A484DFV3_PERFV|nr:hypothetical protein EPR50_G00041660 [Perca flavescens]
MKSLHEEMAATLLTMMLMIPYICQGALLRKSTATDFLQKIREKRESECFPGGCSSEVSEAGELMEAEDVGYEESPSLLYNGGAAHKEINHQSPGGEAIVDEGSGM